jgi:hypothetical protein
MKIRVVVLTIALALVLIVGGVSAQGPVGQSGSGNEIVRYLPEQEGPAAVYAPDVVCGEVDSCTTTWVYYGFNSNASGTRYGLIGGASGAGGIGVYGFHTNVSGTAAGVYGVSSSRSTAANAVLGYVTSTTPGANSAGVRGINNGRSGLGIGVYGSQSGRGWGVYGTTPSGLGVIGSTGSGTGVYGASSTGTGSFGYHTSSSGTAPGTYGYTLSRSSSAVGALGVVGSRTPGSFSAGVRGINNSTTGNGIGVYGSHNGSGWGVFGTTPRGLAVYGSTSTGIGTYGFSNTGTGAFGYHGATTGTSAGVYGYTRSQQALAPAVLGIVGSSSPGGSSSGVRGINNGTSGAGIGVYGSQNGNGWGVFGTTPRGLGVYGVSGSGIGVYGVSSTGIGAIGYHTSASGTSPGVYGLSNSRSTAAPAIYGVSTPTNPSGFVTGVRGHSNGTSGNGIGVWGSHRASGWGVYGQVPSLTSGYAGYFSGRVRVTGFLSKGGGGFEIDHPLDPANKLLNHSFVESPDMMNVYNGNVALDASGEAFVELPDWFGALNREFRYQLSAIGAPGPNLFIAEEIADNHFKIAGGEPGMTVSWQVTGIRQDAFAEAYRMQVEVDKPEELRGTYLHPEAYGQSADKSLTLRSQGLMGDQLEQLYAPTFDGFAALQFEQQAPDFTFDFSKLYAFPEFDQQGFEPDAEGLYPLPELEQEMPTGAEVDLVLPELMER